MYEIPRAIEQIVLSRNKRATRIRNFLKKKICHQLCYGKHSDAFWAVFFVLFITLVTRHFYQMTNLLEIGILATVLSLTLAIFIYTVFSNFVCQKISDRVENSLSIYDEQIETKLWQLSKEIGFKVELKGEQCTWIQDMYIRAGESEEGMEYLDNTATKCVRRYITKDK